MSETPDLQPVVPESSTLTPAVVASVESTFNAYRDAKVRGGTELAMWRPRNLSADAAILKDHKLIRARARDLVRNDPLAKNAVRMNRDAVSGSGLKLSLKIDWVTLGLQSIEAANEYQDHVTREWEAFAESIEFQSDARRQRTFSQLFQTVDQTDFVDGESLAVIELKPGWLYQTCVNLIDVDRLENPVGAMETNTLRGGIERDTYGEPLAYHIREGHPADVGLGAAFQTMASKRVDRQTPWGRPIVLHTFDHCRPEQTRGVSEFAAAITPMRMLGQYNDTELQTAITQAAFAAVIKTEVDWSQAMQVLGTQAKSGMWDMAAAHLKNAAEYYDHREITFNGSKIPHLLPNESLDVLRSTHPNANFEAFESAFIRKLAAGLGVEAHELGKNYREVNYSAARGTGKRLAHVPSPPRSARDAVRDAILRCVARGSRRAWHSQAPARPHRLPGHSPVSRQRHVHRLGQAESRPPQGAPRRRTWPRDGCRDARGYCRQRWAQLARCDRAACL